MKKSKDLVALDRALNLAKKVEVNYNPEPLTPKEMSFNKLTKELDFWAREYRVDKFALRDLRMLIKKYL